MRALGGDALPGRFDTGDKVRVLREVAAKDFAEREQGGDAFVLAALGDLLAEGGRQWIAHVYSVACIINAADVAHPARDAQRQQWPGGSTLQMKTNTLQHALGELLAAVHRNLPGAVL